jgi:5-deoxy-glucuronate isomerase
MRDLLVRPNSSGLSGTIVDITPASAGWRYVGFRVERLAPGETLSGGEDERETCLVVLTGTARISVAGQDFGSVGRRKTVFEDLAPGAVYAPAGTRYRIVALDAAEVGVCSAPGKSGRAARSISSEEMPREVRGSGTNTRYVRNVLPETRPADSLIVVEVITPGGHWSSYPPHKHDTLAGAEETALEETYYHRVDPPQGFAFQRVYTDDGSLDQTMCVHDGDVVLVPRGYHPVGAPHGYSLYYLNVMAGPKRQWIARNDPEHDWIARKR